MTARARRFDIRQAGRRILAGLGLLVLVNLGLYVFYTRPAVTEYQRLLASSQGGFDAVRERQEQVEGLERFRDGVLQAEQDLAVLREDVLATRESRLVDVQLELAQLARACSIDPDTVSYANELMLDEELDRVAITVPLEGGYANLRRFLQTVEDSDKFLIVERVALARGKQGGKLLDLNISMATYFTAPEELVRRKHDQARRGRS